MHPRSGAQSQGSCHLQRSCPAFHSQAIVAPLDFFDLTRWNCSLPANSGFSMLTYCESGNLYISRIYCTLCTILMLLAALVRNFQPKAWSANASFSGNVNTV